jgi:hypothetical protein
LAACSPAYAASPNWHERLDEAMPLLGHRNWILVVDSAYPLQISPGIETIETDASQLDVVLCSTPLITRSRCAPSFSWMRNFLSSPTTMHPAFPSIAGMWLSYCRTSRSNRYRTRK